MITPFLSSFDEAPPAGARCNAPAPAFRADLDQWMTPAWAARELWKSSSRPDDGAKKTGQAWHLVERATHDAKGLPRFEKELKWVSRGWRRNVGEEESDQVAGEKDALRWKTHEGPGERP